MRNNKQPQTNRNSKSFWDKEYRTKGHLSLSDSPSEDLVKFTRFLGRHYGGKQLNQIGSVLDLGCGNGRNLIFLASSFGMKGTGYDISSEAIKSAKKMSADFPITYETRSITGAFPLPDNSQTIVLDMMTSHFLSREELEFLNKEIVRALRPGGWFFWKTFLLDEDMHAKRLLRDHPGVEEGSYIHPKLNVTEHVFSENEIIDLLEKNFTIHKMIKSQSHRKGGVAFKRRSIAVYAEKN